MSVYLELTREFNTGRCRAILSSGQAVVLHGLAVMSKDGDWILREEEEALAFVRAVLSKHGATYRFGAPLDVRWMQGGWSAHFEFHSSGLRVRTDFVTRPPRLTAEDLGALWTEQQEAEIPVVDLRRLAELKKTNRERDYAILGELARELADPLDRLLLSRSARDLVQLAAEHPKLVRELTPRRPLLAQAGGHVEMLEAALDAERRAMIHANERRLQCYLNAAEQWAQAWPGISAETRGLPLPEAHGRIVRSAEGVLPFAPREEAP